MKKMPERIARRQKVLRENSRMFGYKKKDRERIKELEEELRIKDEQINELKVRLLQNEMRPHFIFNILLSIKQLCIEEPRLAADALQNFSKHLRSRIDSMVSTDCVTFQEELSCIENYVELERIEPTANFLVNYDIEYSDFEVPLLSVQPMVENAIRHGIDTQSGEGEVNIRTYRQGENVIIEVSDNGTGDRSETVQQVKHRGIGFSNTKERIRLMCKGDVDIVYTGQGTKVRYVIPVSETA